MGQAASGGAVDLRRSHYVLFLLCGVGVFNAGDRQLLTILIDPIKADLGLTDTGIGLLTGLGFAACYFIASIPMAIWADRGVRRNVIVFCLSFWSLMTALCGLAQNFTQLAAARAGVAIGESGGSPPSHSMIMDLFPPSRRATALALLICSQAFGIALGLAAGGWLSTAFDWRAVFMFAALPGLAWALLIRLTVREPVRGASDVTQEAGTREPMRVALAQLWRLKSMRVLILLAGAGAVTGNMVLGWSPAFFMRVHQIGAGELGYKIGLATCFGLIVGNLAAGRIADRLGARDTRWYMRVAAGGMFLAIPCVFVFLFAPNLYVSLAGLSAAQMLLTAFMAPLFTTALTLSPTSLRATTSMVLGLSLYVVGLGFGPLIIGMLNDALAPAYGAEAVRFSLLAAVVGLLVSGMLALFANRWLVSEMAAKTAIPVVAKAQEMDH